MKTLSKRIVLRWNCRLRGGVGGIIAFLLPIALCMAQTQKDVAAVSAQPGAKSAWHPVSDKVVDSLTAEGKKIAWPGGTAGVSVDRATGSIRMIVPDQGIWSSSDGGLKFNRMDDGSIGGRCETGYALNADPAGRRLACFMLDGKSAMTLDNGKTWNAFQQMGRGWDYGVVDWSQTNPQRILAVHHESGADLHLSEDGGKSWRLLGKDYTAIGIFNAKALVASKGDGILRSADGGATWTKASAQTPTGRVLCVFKGVGYWLSRNGLLVSRDDGATWKLQGGSLESAWGPYFGKDEKQIAVVGKDGKQFGLWRSDDAGETWKFIAGFPDFGKESTPDWTPSKQWAAGWFFNFGWDPKRNVFYASRMGHPTFAFDAR